MSFLLLEHETSDTLADALAFIDAFPFEDETDASFCGSGDDVSGGGDDDDGAVSDAFASAAAELDRSLYVELRIPKSPESDCGSSCSSSSARPASSVGSPSPASSSSSSESVHHDSDAAPPEPAKKLRTRALNTRAVGRYRNRTKTEIAALRDELLQLNALLIKLQRRKSAAPGATNTSGSSSSALVPQHTHSSQRLQLEAATAGIKDAVSEYKRLQEAEALNAKLKDAVLKQRRVSATLEGLFKRQIAKHDLSFVLDIEKLLQPKAPAQERPSPRNRSPAGAAAWDESLVLAELFLYLQRVVYSGTSAALAAVDTGDVDCAFNSTQVKFDPRVGKTLQFTSSTPAASTVAAVDTKLWDFIMYPGASAESGGGPSQFSMKFDCKLADVRADGITAGRKFVEPHRVVLTFSSLIAPLGSGLLFRETGWIVISDAAATRCTTAPVLLQTVYRVHLERVAGSGSGSANAAMPPGLAALHDYVLRAQGDKMNAFQHGIQHWLLQEFAAPIGKGFLGACIDAGSTLE